MKTKLLILLCFISFSAFSQQIITVEGVSSPSPLSLQGSNTKGGDIIKPVLSNISPRQNEVFTINPQGKGLKPTIPVEISGNATDASGIEKVEINGKIALQNPINGDFSIKLDLYAGQHTISINATDNSGNIATITRQIEVVISNVAVVSDTLKKRNLYVLSIGVSEYQYSGTDFSDLDYADDDAVAIANLFKTMDDVLYKDVYTKVLTNENATRVNIIDALEWLEDEPSQGDVVVLFVSSHGFKDGTKSYLMPYDGQVSSLRATAIDFYDINQSVQILSSNNQRNCRVLFLLDACHSGNFGVQGQNARGASQVNVNDAVRMLDNNEYGVMMLHSSTGTELSYEYDNLQHGVFTYALIDALQNGYADQGNDFTITFDELATYVKEKVKNLTNGKQHPVSENPASISEFPVMIIR